MSTVTISKRSVLTLSVYSALFVLSACSGETGPVETTLWYCPETMTGCSAQTPGAIATTRLTFQRTVANMDSDSPDRFCSVVLERLTGNDQKVDIWLDSAHRLTAFDGGRSSFGLNHPAEAADLTCIDAGSTLYLRSCQQQTTSTGWTLVGDANLCTPYYSLLIPDDRDGDMSVNERGHIEVAVTAVVRTTSCLTGTIAGVRVCYDWEGKVWRLDNQSDAAVHLTLEVEARRSVVVDQYYLVANRSENVPSEDVHEGDVVTGRAWVGYVESVINRLLSQAADVEVTFVMSREPSIEIAMARISEPVVILLPAVSGVTCSLYAERATDGTSNTAFVNVSGSSLGCKNGSVDDVKASLYQLKQTDSTGLFIHDFKAGDLSLDPQEEKTNDLATQLQHGTVYALSVQRDNWSDILNPSGRPSPVERLFRLDLIQNGIVVIP